jgi:branched-chain amino acid aminotransferase
VSPTFTGCLASVDGAITLASEARIPATDAGLLRGDGIFEVIRVYDARPFALEDHLKRLERSALNLRLPVDLEAIRSDANRLLAHAGPGEDHELLRIVITRGGRRLLLTEPLPDTPERIRLQSITYSPTRVLDGVKSLSYAGNMLASRLARERGADEALLVTPHGRVLEGPTWSFFWVAGGRLRTPPLEDRILDSITRRYVIEECEAEEAPCTMDDVARAEEAFIASTVREVMPIAAVDEHELPAAPGPVTLEAGERLGRRIGRELAVGA